MKQFYFTPKFSNARKMLASICLVSLSFFANAQTAPALNFQNGVLMTASNTKGNDGAMYNFPNVVPGVDAHVTIAGRYSSDGNNSNVELKTMDETGTGYDSAWQPQINFKSGGSVKANVVTEWYIEFAVAFVKSGTNTSTTVNSFDISGLDVDGNTSMHEVLQFYNQSTYTLENPTSLTTTSVSSQIINTVNGVISIVNGLVGTTLKSGKRFDGGTTEYDGIDVNASKARVTNHYVNTSSFSIRVGGKATGPFTIDNGGRENSLYFKSFSYTNPIVGSLPITLLSFDAQLNGTSKVNTNWVTSAEINASHFVVQRSTDGTQYEDMAIVYTQEGNSNAARNYSYQDNISGVTSTIVYYRLKMVDIDTKYSYSDVEIIRVGKQQEQVSLITYPNPATSQIRVTIPANWQDKSISYNIYSVSGGRVQQKLVSHAGQTETFNISSMPAGLYLIEVKNGDQSAIQKFIKTI